MPTYARQSQRAGPSRRALNEEETIRQRNRVQQSYGRRRSEANPNDEEDIDEGEGSAEDEDDDEDEEEEQEDQGEEGEDGSASEGEEGERRAWQVSKKYFKLSISEATKKLAETKDQGDLKRKANDLVRFALFSEHRRAPIKREDITSKILGKEYQRLYPVIFNRAQVVLRHTFGYEMVELRARGTDNEQIVAAQTRREHRAAANAEEQEKKKNVSKSYIIVSILPPALIARVTRPNPSLQEAFEGTDANGRDSSGVLVDWQKSDAELGSTGLTFLILSLILVHERVLTDDQLRSYLRKLSLKPGTKLPTALQPRKFTPTTRFGDGAITIEDFLDLLTKQSYLERILVQTVPTSNAALEASLHGRRTQARGNLKRTRNSNGTNEQREEFEWRWGARAEAEISEKAVADFIADVFVSTSDGAHLDDLAGSDVESAGEQDAASADRDADVDDDAARQTTRLKKQVLRDVERAAGSVLIV